MIHVLTFYNDFQKYPPIISVIETLLDSGDEVVFLGFCSNKDTLKSLESKGLKYIEVIKDNISSSAVVKFFKLLSYKKRVLQFIRGNYTRDNIKIWVFGERNAWLLHSLFGVYQTILYLFEVPVFKVHFRFKLLSPTLNYTKLMRKASTVVCCEYNRAMITYSFFHLNEIPVIIPNKPVLDNIKIPKLEDIDQDLYEICSTKKVILYQGIFNYPERKLDELCQAMELLPSDYHLVLMGTTNKYKQELETTYKNEQIHFCDFKRFPDHLSVTKMSYIGLLSYFSKGGIIESSLNTLYCAPNKIYEYALCKIPSIANELPAMRTIYNQFDIGEVVDFTPRKIADCILKISENYSSYQGYSDFLQSVDTKELINSIRVKC